MPPKKSKKSVAIQNSSTQIVDMGPYTPKYKFTPVSIRTYKAPKKLAVEPRMLPQTPVGMSNAQTSAKFIPVAHKNKQEKI